MHQDEWNIQQPAFRNHKLPNKNRDEITIVIVVVKPRVKVVNVKFCSKTLLMILIAQIINTLTYSKNYSSHVI